MRRRKRDAAPEQIHACLAGLDLPDPFHLETFLDQLAQRRGRPVRLIAVPAEVPDFPSALWIPFEEADLFFVDETMTTTHGVVSVLHECGHMLLQHTPRVPDDSSWTRVLKHTAAEGAVAYLARNLYDEPEENDADTVATILASRITRTTPSAPPTRVASAAAAEEVLARLGKALGERQ